jgi:hypothetical protein
MTFGEMKDLIANRLGDTSTNTKDRIGEFINDIMFRISDEVQYPGERRWGQIRTESGRYSYPLEPDVGSVIEPMIVPENNANVWSTPVETFNANVQKPTSTGTPHNYMLLGNFGVMRQPASKLVFGSQTNSIDATIYGTVDYLPTSEVLSISNGAVGTRTTTKEFTTVDRITLSGVPSTTMEVRANGTSSDNIKIAEFTTTETEATTSAFGLFNPASGLSIKSSNASDAALRKVVITGYGVLLNASEVVQDNVYLEDELTSNGVTKVYSSYRFTTIESVSIDTESTGMFTVETDPLLSRVIATIPFKQRSLDIPMVGFYPIPDGGRINYQYYRTLTPLTIDADRPPMDKRVHYYIRKWAETAVNQWYGDSSGVSETIQNALPSWQSDIQTIRNVLGLSANPEMVLGGRARSISRKYGPSAMLDPAHYSN